MTEIVQSETAPVWIYANSERQAMDWSLVLISQGIDSAIHKVEENNRWGLAVEAADHDRAWAAIQLYQTENRGWGWREEIPGAKLLFHWGALFWCAIMISFYLAEAVKGIPLHDWGRMDSSAIHQGQWWRLFTAISLHADGGHLASNTTTGFLLLGLAMARFGPGWASLAALLAGAFGNLLGFWLYPEPHRGLGASGMVMGALGMLAVMSVSYFRLHYRPTKYVITGIFSGTCLFLLIGSNPDSDLIAHLGGFLAGMTLGLILALLPARRLDTWWGNFIALAVTAGLAAWTWLLAIH